MDAWNEQRGPNEKRNWVVVVVKEGDPIIGVFGTKITDVSSVGKWTYCISGKEFYAKSVKYQFPINFIGDVLTNRFKRKIKRLIRYHDTEGTDLRWSVYRNKYLQK